MIYERELVRPDKRIRKLFPYDVLTLDFLVIFFMPGGIRALNSVFDWSMVWTLQTVFAVVNELTFPTYMVAVALSTLPWVFHVRNFPQDAIRAMDNNLENHWPLAFGSVYMVCFFVGVTNIMYATRRSRALIAQEFLAKATKCA